MSGLSCVLSLILKRLLGSGDGIHYRIVRLRDIEDLRSEEKTEDCDERRGNEKIYFLRKGIAASHKSYAECLRPITFCTAATICDTPMP
jgi:hypothetical protein